MSNSINDKSREDKAERTAAPDKTDWGNEHAESMIAQLAYAKWEEAGKPRGQWEKYWLEAERQVATVRRPGTKAMVHVPE